VILLQLKLIKLKLEVVKSGFPHKCTQINLQLTGKILLEYDFNSSLFLRFVLEESET